MCTAGKKWHRDVLTEFLTSMSVDLDPRLADLSAVPLPEIL